MNGIPENISENQHDMPQVNTCEIITNDVEPTTVVEKTQNDHLNKRLLCSFMEKLNQTQVEPCENSAFNVENETDEFEDK